LTSSDTSTLGGGAVRSVAGRYALVGFVVVLGLVVTFWCWHTVENQAEQEEQGRFAREVQNIQETLRDRFNAYTDALRGATALFGASVHVDRAEWHSYVETLGILEHYPGIQGVGFSQRIPAAEKETHVAAVRAEGFTGYDIRPSTPREEYHSIVYLEPFTNRNLRAFGYDMFSEETRRAAMERSRDLGLPALSGKVILVQETDRNPQSGFLLYVPVYRNGQPHGTIDERRNALLGFVYGVFRADDLLGTVIGNRTADVGLMVYDGASELPANLMHDGVPGEPRAGVVPRFQESRSIEIAGHPWILRFCTLPSFDRSSPANLAMLLLAGGVLLTVFLGAFLINLIRQAAKVERLVLRRTVELKHANSRLELENAERRRVEAQRLHSLEDLAVKNGELERFNSLAVGRELRMIELKREINALSRAAGSDDRYSVATEDKGTGWEAR
jgi:CHASE1-domain containing sensor protein